MVLRVDDLGEQLLSLVTADVQKVSSHSQEQLGLSDTVVSRSSQSLLALEGSKDRLLFTALSDEIFLMYIIFLEAEIVVQGHRYKFAGCRMQFFCPFDSYLPTR